MVEDERRPGRAVRRWIDDILMWCGPDVHKAILMTVVRQNCPVLADHGSEGGGGGGGLLLRDWRDGKVEKARERFCYAILKFHFRFRYWPTYIYRHVILHRSVKFHQNRTIRGGVMTSNRFFKMAAMESKIHFWVRFYSRHSLGRSAACVPNFDEIAKSTAEIKLLPVSENGPQPYWILLPVSILINL